MKKDIYENLYNTLYQRVGIYMYFCTKYLKPIENFYNKTNKIKV